MKHDIKIFDTSDALVKELSRFIIASACEAERKNIALTIALSGGTTPGVLFSYFKDHYASSAFWNNVHFFWVDERCVPPEDEESNFGMFKRNLLDYLSIKPENVHRIKGEDDPETESLRYSSEIRHYIKCINGIPSFDIVLLGLGEDGHTASIFPYNIHLLESEKICEVSQHPVTSGKRITITGKVINNTEEAVFMVTGKKKADVVYKILKNNVISNKYPASHIMPRSGHLRWFLDSDAAGLLQMK